MGDTLSPEYIAGFLDGEGCFRFLATPIVEAATTYPETLRDLHESYGGTFTTAYQPDLARKPMFRWYVMGPNADRLLEDILPHLREKHRQASLLRKVLRYPPKTEMRQAFLRELKALKRIPYKTWFTQLKTSS